MLLAIDTSTRCAGVALIDQDGHLLRLVQWHSRHNHSVELLPAIQALLDAEDTTAQDLAGIALASGPGNFSALRVGFSVAKGFALAWDTPLIAVDTLLCEAFTFRAAGVPVAALLDAGRGEVAWTLFTDTGSGFQQSNEPRISSPDELINALPPHALLCGEGLEHHELALAEAVASAPGQVRLALPYLRGLRVSALAHLGHARLTAGQTDDAASLQPAYLRAPTITPPRPRS